MKAQTPQIKIFVDDLNENIKFYAAVFGKAPTLANGSGAVWITDEPSLRFEIAAGANQSRQYSSAGLV